jgi:luciferase family oxidoreductase group 1
MAGNQTVRLSVLDQSPIREGGTAADALGESIELAQHAEALGYHRYWLAEHHGSEGLAGPSPEIMITRIAAETSHIRVGSGGVMLPHYSPYKVAENFRLLETLFPGRVDLGIGRAPGSDFATSRALAYGSIIGAEYFPNLIQDLSGFLNDSIPADHPLGQVKARPKIDNIPPIWLLGSSDYSGAYAAHYGLAFSFAHFINPVGGEQVMQAYFEKFQPSPGVPEPIGNIGVFVVCADTEADAERIAKTRDLQRLRADQGYHGPMPSIEEAEAYRYSPPEQQRVDYNRARTILGDPVQVKSQLLELTERYNVDELVVITNVFDFANRKRSYALLADAFDLKPERQGTEAAE